MSHTVRLPPTLDRLVTTTNAHDLDGLVGCFAEDYRLTMPNHPARDFTGPGQVRRNWEQFFTLIPDIRTTITRAARGADGEWWTEWEISGTRRDGSRHLMRGVMIMTVGDGEHDQVRANRFYVEPTDTDGSGDGSGDGIDAAIAMATRGGAS